MRAGSPALTQVHIRTFVIYHIIYKNASVFLECENYALRYFYKGYSLRGNPPPFRPNNIRTKTAIPKHLFCYNSPKEEWSPSLCLRTGMIGFAILLLYSENNGRVKTLPYNCNASQTLNLPFATFNLPLKNALAFASIFS